MLRAEPSFFLSCQILVLLDETDKRKQEFIERFNRLVAQLSTPAICQNVVGLGVGFSPPSEMSLLLGEQQSGAAGQPGAAGGVGSGAIGLGAASMMSALGARQSGSGPSSGRGSQGSSALGFVPVGSLHTSAQGSAGEPRTGSLANTAPSLPLAPGRAGPDTGRVPSRVMHHGRYVMCYQVLCDFLDQFAEVAQQLKQAAIHETGIAAVYVVGQKSTLQAAVQSDQAAAQEASAGGDSASGVGVAPPAAGGSSAQSVVQSASSLSAQARLLTAAQATFTYASQPLKIAHSKQRGPPGGTRKGVVGRGGPGSPPYTAIFPAELSALAAQAIVFFAPPVVAAPASASAAAAAASSGGQQSQVAEKAATASSGGPAVASAGSLVAPAAAIGGSTPRRPSLTSGSPPVLGPGGALTVPEFVRTQLELTLLPRLSSGGFALNSTDLVAGIFWQHYREKLTSIARNMLSDSLDTVQMIFRNYDDH